ncbi:MAG: Na+:solute symporter [Bacteroidales bacterium]|nr:Na+:solute symporter [Bacteroidales bacterium]
MKFIDYFIVISFITFFLILNYILSKKVKDTSGFFVGSRKLPWYIAGTSMVATTFAADTPLAVTELVAENGISGNWLWWNMIFGGMLTVYFFAKLWRKSNILTDCEFISFRYDGKSAKFLRMFRALYIGLFMNSIVIAWVNLAMVKITKIFFPDITFFGLKFINLLGFNFSSHILFVGCIMVFVAFYSSLAGLKGTSITDSIQFSIAMIGCIILAIYSLKHPLVGGIDGLKQKLPNELFSFIPNISSEIDKTGTLKLPLILMFTYFFVQWWASWYPGAEPGGGGYIAQRILSAKNEKHSIFATMWFQIAHYALRPWPWIVVALASLIVFPSLPLKNRGEGFVLMITHTLPSGLVGLLLAAFLCAYMSTISSQLLLGTSYLVNDFFKLLYKTAKTEKYLLRLSKFLLLILMLVSFFITSKLDKISNAWKFVIECSAGVGPWLLLRWYWWRVNAYSEISAIITPFLIYPILLHFNVSFPYTLLIILLLSFIVSLVVTLLTPPVANEKLKSFFEKVRPLGPGWKNFNPNYKNEYKEIFSLLVAWFLSVIIVLLFLFLIGKLIFKFYFDALILLIIIFITFIPLYKILNNYIKQ